MYTKLYCKSQTYQTNQSIDMLLYRPLHRINTEYCCGTGMSYVHASRVFVLELEVRAFISSNVVRALLIRLGTVCLFPSYVESSKAEYIQESIGAAQGLRT